MRYGPNTNGGSSNIRMLEYQVEYMTRLLDAADEVGTDWIDVRRDVTLEYDDRLQMEFGGIEVLEASCNGYDRSPSGRIVTRWPHDFAAHRARIDQDSLASFEAGRGVISRGRSAP